MEAKLYKKQVVDVKKKVIKLPSLEKKKDKGPSMWKRFLQRRQSKNEGRRTDSSPPEIQQVETALPTLLPIPVEVQNKKSNGPEINQTVLRRKVQSLLGRMMSRLKTEWQEQALERSFMYENDEAEKLRIEMSCRYIERPFREHQAIGHRNYLTLLSNCKLVSPILSRLLWIQTVNNGNSHSMLVHVQDPSEDTSYLLQTLPCPSFERSCALKGELDTLRNIENPYLVKVHNVFQHTFQAFATSGSITEQTCMLFIMLEHCSGRPLMEYVASLTDSLGNPRSISKNEVLILVGNIATALDSLHRHDWIHGNLKLDNVYRTDAGDIRLGSYFCCKDARSLQNLQKRQSGGMNESIRPPEMLCGENDAISTKADVWSLGILVHQLVTFSSTTQRYYAGPALTDLSIEQILRTLPLRFGKTITSLLRMCLQKKASLRAHAQDVFDFVSLETDWADVYGQAQVRKKSVIFEEAVPMRRRTFVVTALQQKEAKLIGLGQMKPPALHFKRPTI